ncbi:MAG: diguanylate cyclase [Phycisphaerales bacterium]|nr:diguanylate cyclase [Phycisphaerales bacterium]
MTIRKINKAFYLSLGLLLTGLTGLADFLTGYELSISIFYVIPVAIVTWFTGLYLGLLTSFICAFVWLGADTATGHQYSYPLIPVWNCFIRLAFFVIITLLLSELSRSIERERKAARTDNLTGAVNSRFFYELIQIEIERFRRHQHPFSLAYIDLDNFKAVNDQHGHSVGDQVLRIVTDSAMRHLRKSDVVARLGGDEFALLLAETDEKAAQTVISKVQDILLEEMGKDNLPVTFSIGVVMCRAAPPTTDELVKIADKLMYSVKYSGRNAVKFLSYKG